MSLKLVISFVGFILISCGQAQNIDKLKDNYIFDFGVYVERVSGGDTNRYTVDNKVYTINRKFVFDYSIIREGDTLMITAPKMIKPDDDFRRTWDFIKKNKTHENKIESISIKVMSGISNESQTLLNYEYQYPHDLGYSPFSSTSGVIENELNVWMHPPRDKYFSILELNPFPYIQQPYQIGNKWKWELEIGDNWQDHRWKNWNGTITNKYEYEIIGKEVLSTQLGKLDCWVVRAKATSELGSTKLIGHFNEKCGFIKLDFFNIDESRLILEIKEIK